MKGLELSRQYYLDYGKPMLEGQFPDLHFSAGLFGSGSECYGYDDEFSQDHDFEPGFCIFIPDDVDDRTAFQLEKAYNYLPKIYRGYRRSTISPVGGNRHGVFRISEFFEEHIDSPDGNLTIGQWFSLPEYALLEMTNGEIFSDSHNLITPIRNRLAYYPEDIRIKKIASNLLLMNQTGQYNYPRCIQRNDIGAGQLAVNEFVQAAGRTVFLLNRKYAPYYKWFFAAMKGSEILSETVPFLEYLLNSGNTETEYNDKVIMIETVCELITDELIRQNLLLNKENSLEKAAYIVNDHITDNDIRNMNILAGV